MNFVIMTITFLYLVAFGSDKTGQVKDYIVGAGEFCLHQTSGDLKCVKDAKTGLVPLKNVGKLKKVRADVFYACGLTVDGEFVCWGDLPNPAPGVDIKPPMQVKIPEGFKIADFVTGGLICLLFDSGHVACWGETKGRFIPSLEFVKSDFGKFKSVAGNINTVCGVTDMNELLCWGWRISDAPVRLATSEKVKDVAISGREICVLTEAGALKCFQDDVHTNLVTYLDKDVSKVVSNGIRICAQKKSELYCFGTNFGNQEERVSRKPILILDSDEIESFTTGCALLKNKMTKCWKGFLDHPEVTDGEGFQ